jgi:outer membrane protein TolC
MPPTTTPMLACLLLAARLVAGEASPSSTPQTINLPDALRLVHTQGREGRFASEELLLAAQSFAVTRGDYRPQPTGSIGVGTDHTPPVAGLPATTTTGATASLGVSQTLPSNGTVTVAATASQPRIGNADSSTTTSLTAGLVQPLLRDAGYAAWRERLTQAERGWVYAQRNEQRYRQQLSLGTAQAYWNLQRQQDGRTQAAAAEERARFLYEQSKALMAIGRTNANDVFRAEIGFLSAQQARIDAEATYAAQLNQFKQTLALPTVAVIAIPDTLPPARRWRVDAARAIATALERRLDWHTTEDQREDAARQVPLARQRMWADLSLTANATWGGQNPDGDWVNPVTREPGYDAALTLTIPFDRRNEALAYQQAMTGLARAERASDAARQDLIRQVTDDLANLRRADTSRLVQERNRAPSRKRQEKARLDFQAGMITNRDLIEAQADVLAADQAWAAALTGWAIAALTLRYDTGTLAVDQAGAWDEAPPAFADEEATP